MRRRMGSRLHLLKHFEDYVSPEAHSKDRCIVRPDIWVVTYRKSSVKPALYKNGDLRMFPPLPLGL